MMQKLSLALVLSMLVANAFAQEVAWSPVQIEVWDREETYWKTIAARDVSSYLDLWDESFVGWPHSQKVPIGKSTLREHPFGSANRMVSSYQFEHKSVQVHGETAITFLQIRITQTFDGQKSGLVERLTHTWQKRDGVWRIVGGMSCTVKPDGNC
jgi:ketosteroid isomerase-like protein